MNDTAVNWRRRPPAFAVPETAVRRLALRPIAAQTAAGTATLYSANRLIAGTADASKRALTDHAAGELDRLAAKLGMAVTRRSLAVPRSSKDRTPLASPRTGQSRIDLAPIKGAPEPDAWELLSEATE